MVSYLTVISMSAAMSVVWGSCVHTATQKAMACTSQLDIGFFTGSSSNKPIGQGNIDRLVLACRNGNLLTAIGCIEMVMDECKSNQSDATFLLRKMIDTKKARKSIDFFCTNIRVYNSNIECIARHHKEQDVCAEGAKNRYKMQASSTGNVDVLLLLHCAFYRALMECVQIVLQVKCSDEAAHIVKTVMEGFESPVCSEKITTAAASVNLVDTDIMYTQSIQSDDNDSDSDDSDNNDSDIAFSSCCNSSVHSFLIVLSTALILVLCC